MVRQRKSTDEVKSGSLQATVPFSWERKPGTSKVKPHSSDHRTLDHYFTTTTPSLRLVPPPAHLSPQLSISSTAGHRQSRGSPCLCCSSPTTAKKNRLQEDPFLAAFIKCTQLHSSGISNSGRRYVADAKHDAAAARYSARKKNTWFSMFTGTFSCKYSAVRDDKL